MDLSFFSSAEGIAIAWICTVVAFIYALFQKNQVSKTKQILNSVNISYSELKVENENLRIENNNLIQTIESNDIHDNYQDVKQIGKNNVNQGVVKGDVTFDLS
jgi:regulator of replication initiation timing